MAEFWNPTTSNLAHRCSSQAGQTSGTHRFVDETYVKVAGKWAYMYRAADQHGQVIDVLLSRRHDLAAARRFLPRALRACAAPAEVTTDRALVYPRIFDELIPSALHTPWSSTRTTRSRQITGG